MRVERIELEKNDSELKHLSQEFAGEIIDLEDFILEVELNG